MTPAANIKRQNADILLASQDFDALMVIHFLPALPRRAGKAPMPDRND